MKKYNLIIYGSFIVFTFFLALYFFKSEYNLLGISWIDKRPSSILGYKYTNNSCVFKINYMANWNERVIVEEERAVTFLYDKKTCEKAYEYLTQPKMALSVGAKVKDDGSWEIIINHNKKIFKFEDKYIKILNQQD